ncbi:transposase [Microbacterium sp. X-17]|uniref:transposase n=1 Tax=Microbacterium sp. X-17 TaxID=3144404 RepID=UPI0031F57847
MDDAFASVADELYGLPPAEFIAARTARASGATPELATRITGLRKPVVAAWAVNLLVRDGQLGRALELAAALRTAQEELSAEELTQLGRQRRQLVAALARRAAELARERGATLSPAAREAVSTTINAAVLDERAAALVATGRLLAPLEPGDLDGIDLGAFVAGPGPEAPSAPSPRSRDELVARRARKAAEAAVRAAEHEASEAERARVRIEARRRTVREHADVLGRRAEELRAELGRVLRDAEAADADLARLDDEHRAAASRAEAAAGEAARARSAAREPMTD